MKRKSNVIGKKEIIEILDKYKKEFAEQYDILKIGVFGSTARDEAGKNNDVDVVIQISKTDLFMLVGIKNDLEERLRRPVDIVTYRENINQFLKKKIDKEAETVFFTCKRKIPQLMDTIRKIKKDLE